MTCVGCRRQPRAVAASTHAAGRDGEPCHTGRLGKTMPETTLSDALTRLTQGAAHRLRGRVWTAAPLAHALLVLAWPLVAWPVVGVGDSRTPAPHASQAAEVWAVEAAFREAFQLWADERLDALWARGLLASRDRVSREAFVRGMRHRVVKPTCCWGQLPAVQVHLQTAEEALVEAQVGVDVKTLGTTVVRSMLVYLRREEGGWRVRLEDFLTKPEDALSDLRGRW
jgi:hypothetical protein